jgi:hypothetical protein
VNEQRLFAFLKRQSPSALLDLLQHAYRAMSVSQRQAVFQTMVKDIPASAVEGTELLKRLTQFHRDSLARQYYAPFEINSKNYTQIPDETEEWFEILGELLEDSSKLTEQEEHALAVACFGLLYELIDYMETGEEIVFADEVGSWMIPGEEKKFMAAYLSSLAVVASPESFTTTALPLLKRDSTSSFSCQVYATAVRVANKEQRAQLKAEIKRQHVRTTSKR